MESFTLFRKHLAMSGIVQQQSSQKSHSFNVKNSIVLILATIDGILLYNQLHVTNTFEDYTDTVYKVIFMCTIVTMYFITIWRSSKLFRFIDCLENGVNNSEQHSKEQVTYPEVNSFELVHHLLFRIQNKFGLAIAIRGNQSTNSKMVENHAFYHFDSDASAILIAIINIELLCLFHHRFGI